MLDKTWYGIVVTYKEMYLGFGASAWEEFLKAPIQAFINKNNIPLQVLPPERLFFISSSDWDWIVQAIKDKSTKSLQELLDKAKDCNLSDDPKKKVFMMEQILRKYFHIGKFNLSYLENAHKLLDVLPKTTEL